MSLRLSLAVAAALLLVACNQASADKDPAQTDSDLKQAKQDSDSGNFQAAAADYETVVSMNPKLPDPHYELGVIYGDKLSDPISSIYHFKRFLDLSPNTDKKDQVQALIDKEGQDFAASLPHNGPQITQADMDKLSADNAALKKQVDDANTTIARLQEKLKHHGAIVAAAAPDTAQASASATTDAPAVAAAPATPSGPQKALPVDPAVAAQGNADTDAAANPASAAPPAGARSYTVVKGDNFWKIAHKMYPGHTKEGVDKIRDANKQVNERNIKPGQVLVIP